ncbi:hypothetical protein FCL47_17425 [Desulfopila sp. IMCC35006]|uniref:hypothetical protein n=1 Tax=Desulfopila sp. IMCC35006 TaxID=2569542 RepID=UPI0010ACC8C9|nr:hypothetical protein [Desulfopila sp. IMCC35006]TKB24614.1 hypothetical protein FCL47_17425 [Desulfopila sp. IMCC35006]
MNNQTSSTPNLDVVSRYAAASCTSISRNVSRLFTPSCVMVINCFLYKPILDAIDALEQLIAKQLEEAEKQRTAAEDERRTLRQKKDTFGGQCDELMQRAENKA